MTFAAPLFLLAALAAAIPLVLHMINRQKAPVRPFSTLRFLRLSAQKTRRRKYLHDLLLLLLRVAPLLLIAIGLAGPTVHRLQNLLGRRAATAAVLILDNSASMGSRDQAGQRWEAARKACDQLLDQLSERDRVALLTTCGPDQPRQQRLYENHDVVRQALDVGRVSYERADLAARLRDARRLLEESPAPNKEIYLVSDMQSVSWNTLAVAKPAGAKPADDAAAGDAPAERIPLVIVNVRGAPLPNVGVREVKVHSAAPVAGVPFVVSVSLRGDFQVSQRKHVELLLDGRQVAVSPTLAIGAGQVVEHTFQVSVDRPGLHAGEARLAGEDACPLDDRSHFAVAVDPRISVAVVKRRDHEVEYLDDGYYLTRALHPVADESWSIHVRPLTPDGLLAESLDPYDVIYCVNLPAPRRALAERLVEYMQRGGHVFWISGERVEPAAYDVLNDQVDRQLLPLAIESPRDAPAERPEGWSVGWLDGEYPPLTPLTEPVSLYQSVRVTRHLPFVADDQSGARILARLDDGQPLLVERPVGAGSTLMLGISAHVDWSNLPLRPLFLPLIARLTFHLADANAAQPQLVAGAPLVVSSPGGPRVGLEVRRPDGETVRIQATESSPQLRYTQTHEVGIYQVQVLGEGVPQPRAYAVNMDPREQSGAAISAEQLQQRLGDQPLVFCEDASRLEETLRTFREGRSLWELFLVGVLIALVAESYVANRLTRSDEVASTPARARSQRASGLG